MEAESLSDYDQALRKIHFPEHPGQLARAQERLKFDELFTLELGVAFRKHRVEAEQAGVAHAAAGPLTRAAGRRRSRSSRPERRSGRSAPSTRRWSARDR